MKNRRANGPNGERNRIEYRWRLDSYKGIQYVIETLPFLEGYRLKVIGTGSYEKELLELARRLNIYDRIDGLKDIER